MRSSFLLRTARGQSLDNTSSLRGWLHGSPKGKREDRVGHHSPFQGRCQVEKTVVIGNGQGTQGGEDGILYSAL